MEVYLILNRKARNIDFYRNLGIIRSFFFWKVHKVARQKLLSNFFSAKGGGVPPNSAKSFWAE